ncbi:MAG: hypothetical protein JETT_0105 [Candidatus Jettenia ecosi]|uniref:Uncharacterized protein n=1 Tax=Candidatus Jettenia ecosi TaxID=2494326 RepID=A0A533QGC2_9BACT|nr:MAG: hypothetical protein JETT_0105 [Candidatus Jettenia ecosi]
MRVNLYDPLAHKKVGRLCAGGPCGLPKLYYKVSTTLATYNLDADLHV